MIHVYVAKDRILYILNAGRELKLCIDEVQCIVQPVVLVIVVATVKVCTANFIVYKCSEGC